METNSQSFFEEDNLQTHEIANNYKIKKMKFILKIPLIYHTNFIGTVLFIIGSIFFLFPSLYIMGCLLFTFGCALCGYSSILGAINVHLKKKNEFYGYIFYIIGCQIFIGGSIYSCYKDDYYAVASFIIGSLFFLIGAILFFFSVELKKIKFLRFLYLTVLTSNLIGGALFTAGSIFFLYSHLYNEACLLFVFGSVLFTLATSFEYIIYIKNNF